MRRSSAGFVCVLTVASAIAAVVVLAPWQEVPLGWDEVDYADAAAQGVWANAIDRAGLPPLDLVRFIWAKAHGKTPRLPERYAEENDPAVLRHYHPPLVPMAMAMLAGARDEPAVRRVQMLGAVALVVAMACTFWALGGRGVHGLVVVLLIAIWAARLLFASLSFHGWFAVWATTTAVTLALYHEAPTRRNRVALSISLGLALLTLQSALLLWASAVAIMLLYPTGLSAAAYRLRETSTALGWAAAIVICVWPAVLLKLSLLRTFALHAYAILFIGHEYSHVPGHAMQLLWTLSPGVAAGILAVALVPPWRCGNGNVVPVIAIGAVYSLGLARFAISPTYVLPGLAPLACVAGLGVERVSRSSWRTVIVGALAIMTTAAWPPGSPAVAGVEVREDLNWLNDRYTGRVLLADGAHVLRYYLDRPERIETLHVSEHPPCLVLREHGTYRPLRTGETDGKVVVLQAGRSLEQDCLLPTLIDCALMIRPTVRVFDCGLTQAPVR